MAVLGTLVVAVVVDLAVFMRDDVMTVRRQQELEGSPPPPNCEQQAPIKADRGS